MAEEKQIYWLYGALGGDIIGSVYEHNNLKCKEFELFSFRSKMTDDSYMTLATAEAIVYGTSYRESYLKWGTMYPSAGYGSAFWHWLNSENPEPYNSWGNGSAMRVSPVGFAFHSKDKVLAEAEKSAICTHNHPEGIKGAQAAAYAVYLARTGACKEKIRTEIEREFQYDLSEPLDSIRAWYQFDVSCQGTLPVALIAFLCSESYEDTIRNAVSVGGDSDTIAAIAGSVALAFYREMPDGILAEIQNRLCEPLQELCAEFQRICLSNRA